MLQTLFYIPHFLFEGPLLFGWLILGILIFAYLAAKNGFTGDTFSFLFIYAVVAVAIGFILPKIEVHDLNNEPLGIAVRGYGLFLIIAISAGLTVAWIRCRQINYSYETVLSLAFWMILLGIVGARVFYIVQKWDEELAGKVSSPSEIPLLLINVTEGGLVVYGAVIGGVVAMLTVVFLRKLPLFKIADIIAPGMVIGLALGRIGCLMNGCCFGGACDLPGLAIQFPAGSPPYMRQIETGELFGMKTVLVKESEPGTLEQREVIEVAEDSPAARQGIQVGDRIGISQVHSDVIREVKKNPDSEFGAEKVTILNPRMNNIDIYVGELPDRSIGVHPTQIYSSINAALIFLFLWFYYPYRKGHGEVFAWMLILYAVTRFLLELIRIDEMGIWGTPFSISQWISFGALAGGLVLLFVCRSYFPVLPVGIAPEAATID